MKISNNILYCFVPMILIAMVGWGLYIWEYNQEKGEGIIGEDLTNTIENLQTSYNRFRRMSGKQLHDVWNELFWDCEYQLDGKIRENEYDCGTAETKFWRTLGANVVYENTKMKETRLKRVADSRKSIKEVMAGDVIIFKREGKYGHIGIVDRVKKGKIRFMEFNIGDNGQGFRSIKFNDSKIQNIYPMNFDYWAGDVLYMFDKVEKK